jgi:16S rRNA (cytosine1402-N4)-methyltransferase
MSLTDNSPFHTPVLLKETMSLLKPRSGCVYLDGTVGGGGHTRAILEASAPDGRVFGLDRDPEAVKEAASALQSFGERAVISPGNFSRAQEIFPGQLFDGILLDLGVSSHQLDTPRRGFSCDRDGPLDMRMDEGRSMTAADFLSQLSEEALARVFRDYGESPFSRILAREIVRERVKEPIKTTGHLARTVRRAVPSRSERKSLVQAFQALRILVNNELDCLQDGLGKLFETLAPPGRMAVISYHSLEDRIVKLFFRQLANPCTCPPDLPVCACGKIPRARILSHKVIRPTGNEIAGNPRSRSARLRAVEKLTDFRG